MVAEEDLILAVTDALTQALDDAHLTQAELAQRLGRTPGYVSQIFGGGRNLTLRTVANIARALSMRPTFMLTHEGGVVGNQPTGNVLSPNQRRRRLMADSNEGASAYRTS